MSHHGNTSSGLIETLKKTLADMKNVILGNLLGINIHFISKWATETHKKTFKCSHLLIIRTSRNDLLITFDYLMITEELIKV